MNLDEIRAEMRPWRLRLGELSAKLGRSVQIDAAELLDRSDVLPLQTPGIWSPGGTCRLVRCRDGWLAVNLSRESDRDYVPAWLQCDLSEDAWSTVLAGVRGRPRARLLADARLLGLPISIVGEAAGRPANRVFPLGAKAVVPDQLYVVDLTSMWAGPLCGAILADMGADVVKVETFSRPDGTARIPRLNDRLNGRKRQVRIDFDLGEDRRWLDAQLAEADIILTSARKRAFDQLGLRPEELLPKRAGQIWVAISGYGWSGDGSDRTAFGDDAAAAGGLLNWTDGQPHFIGDALADPLTGVSAAVAALAAIEQGGGVFIDMALAGVAADMARRIDAGMNPVARDQALPGAD